MSDYIKREDAVNAFRLWVLATHGHRYTNKECAPVFASIPHADVVPKDFHNKTCEAMAKRHTEEIQRLMPKRGEWEEKEVFHNGDDEPIVEEWQSAMCSVCHKYHTTPYMYYFNEYNFCPNCGADMRKESE